MQEAHTPNCVKVADGIRAVQEIAEARIHLILSDIPYGIGVSEWDVLHNNTNSALLGTSPAQERAGAVFRNRGKPLNGWSEADRQIPMEYQRWCQSFAKLRTSFRPTCPEELPREECNKLNLLK